MSGRITQPVGQVRLTNVAIVRLRKMGKRFEVAAYKNKVVNWRNKVETDINEVLQTTTVFSNVSKGIVANAKDLEEAFGSADHLKCALIVLEKGELEVGEKERAALLESLFSEIALIIAEKCVNPETHRPYTHTLIERALRDCHFSVNPAKSAKQQALKAVALLRAHMPIERAKMTIRATFPNTQRERLFELLGGESVARVDSEVTVAGGSSSVITASVDPGVYGKLTKALAEDSRITVEVLSLAVAADAGADGGGRGGRGRAAAEDADMDDERDVKFVAVPAVASAAAARPLGSEVADPTDGRASASAAAVAASGRPGVAAASVDEATAAAARGTGMAVRRVVQPTARSKCGTCRAEFESPDAFKEHMRTDWHRANLKRKVKGKEPFTAEDFDALPESERAAALAME